MVKYIKRQMTNSEKNTDKGLISPNISRELILISGGGKTNNPIRKGANAIRRLLTHKTKYKKLLGM